MGPYCVLIGPSLCPYWTLLGPYWALLGPLGPLGGWFSKPGDYGVVSIFKNFTKICIFGILGVQNGGFWAKSAPAGGVHFQKFHKN